MSRVLFLDFDGVLNSSRWWSDRRFSVGEYSPEELALRASMPVDAIPDYIRGSCSERRCLGDLRMLDPDAVALVNELVRATGADVVVSSTWRHGYSLNGLRWLLSSKGFTGQVIGVTPSEAHHRIRGEEIQAWLDLLPIVSRFVILDDDDDMGALAPYLVRTDRKVGLTRADVERACAILLGEESRWTNRSISAAT